MDRCTRSRVTVRSGQVTIDYAINHAHHDFLGNPFMGRITDAPSVLNSEYTSAHDKAEWREALKQHPPVIARWLETITPNLPAGISESAGWRVLVRRAR